MVPHGLRCGDSQRVPVASDPHDRLTDDRGAESAGNGADFTGDRFAFPLGEVRCRELSVEAAPVLGE